MCLAGQVANPSSMSFECSDLIKSKKRGQWFHNHLSCWYQSDTFEHEIECISNCQNKRRHQFGLYLPRLYFSRQVLETPLHFFQLYISRSKFAKCITLPNHLFHILVRYFRILDYEIQMHWKEWALKIICHLLSWHVPSRPGCESINQHFSCW